MKRILFIFLTTILFTVYAVSLFAANRLVDDADLLTASEKNSVSALLDKISEQQKCDVIIVTINDNPADTDTYAENYFHDNDYGYGENKDAILLLISIADNDWWAIYPSGFAETAFTSAGKTHIIGVVKQLLSEDKFYEAFTTFAKKSDDFLTQAKSGKPYDNGNLPGKGITLVTILISIGIGLVMALIITANMKSALKTVNKQARADEYVHPGSMQVTASRETFLYKETKKTERQTSTNSGSGKGSSSSSSGKF